MTSEVQGPSGTHFDPCPQFCVDQAEQRRPQVPEVTGRCFFGPVCTGMVFDGIAPPRDGEGGWIDPVDCRLLVAEAYFFGRLVNEIDQGHTARLILAGDVPACLACDAVLIVRGASDRGWKLGGGLWRR